MHTGQLNEDHANGRGPERDNAHSVLRAVALEKSFGHVDVLRSVTMDVHSGEVVALIGDNGAGKTTLTKCLCGVYQPDAGHVELEGVRTRLGSIRDAEAAGIGVVHQDLALAPDLTVLENLFLGHEVLHKGPVRWLGILDRRRMGKAAEVALSELAARVPSVYAPVRVLSGGQRQAVAIARAKMWARTAILMDEPTAALGVRQSRVVAELIRETARSGLGVLVISHDLPRMLEIADRVIVLWRGQVALEATATQVTVPDLVEAMVGHTKADLS